MYPQRPESIRFLAHMLDVDDRGRITPQNVEFFWNGVLSHPTMLDQDLPDAESIINEVFDMVRAGPSTIFSMRAVYNSVVWWLMVCRKATSGALLIVRRPHCTPNHL